MQKLLQPLLAHEDYETFKAMMVKKNVDLELQALQLLQVKLGQSLDVYQQRDPNAAPFPSLKEKLAKRDAEEEREYQDAVKLSLEESDLKRLADDEEMERLLELAIQESLKLYKMQAAEQEQEDELAIQESLKLYKMQAAQEQEDKREETKLKASKDAKPSCDKQQVKTDLEETRIPEGHSDKREKERAGRNTALTQPINTKRQVQTTPEEAKVPDMTRESPKHGLIPLDVGRSEFRGLGHSIRGGGEMTGEQAAQLWIQSAKSELESRHSPLLKHRASVSYNKEIFDSSYVAKIMQKGLPSDLKAREKYLKEQRNRLLESKKKKRDEMLKRYKEAHPRPQQPLQNSNPSPAGTVTRNQQETSNSDVSRAGKTTATTQKPPTGQGRSQSRVLCSIIAKKLKEEQT